MKAALKNLTTDVNHYYNESMQRIADQPDTGDIVFNLLKWVTCARSPIHVNDLKLALGVESDQTLNGDFEDLFVDVLRYIGLSEGLVSLRISDTIASTNHSTKHYTTYNPSKVKGPEVELAHESVRDYFRADQAWIPRDGDALILNTCLTAMASPIFIDHLQDTWQEVLIRVHSPYDAQVAVSVKHEEHSVVVPEFLFWALSCWGQHLRADHLTTGVMDMMSRIHQVCQSQTDEWIEDQGPLYYFQTRSPIPISENHSERRQLPLRPASAEADLGWRSRVPGSCALSYKRSSGESLNEDRLENPSRIFDARRPISSEGRKPRSRGGSIASLPSINDSSIEDLYRTQRYLLLYEFMLRSSGPRAGPLLWCAYWGWLEGCRFFLPLETDPNLLFKGTARVYAETALSAAVATGNPELVQLLLQNTRVDPEAGYLHYKSHVTPLMQACDYDDAAIVQLLLSHDKINVNACYEDFYGTGLPPIFRCSLNTLPLLLGREDLNVNKLTRGCRPIHKLVYYGGRESELKMLLQRPDIDINALTGRRDVWNTLCQDDREDKAFENSRTALMVAAVLGRFSETAILLNDARIDIRLRDSCRITPLMLVAMGYTRADWVPKPNLLDSQDSVQPHAKTVEALLLSMSGRINAQDKQGQTATAVAAMCGKDPRAKDEIEGIGDFGSLYRAGCERTLRRIDDKTHFIAIMKLLLGTTGVDVDLPDDAGHTPLDHARHAEDLVIQERDLMVKDLGDAMAKFKPGDGPTHMVRQLMNSAQKSLESITCIQALLIAAGANGGKPIPVRIKASHRKRSQIIRWLVRSRQDLYGGSKLRA